MKDLSFETVNYKYQSVFNNIIDQIKTGVLIPGAKAPSLRLLSRQMRLSISTIMKAYIELEQMGYLEARPQSGFYIVNKLPSADLCPKITQPSIKPTKVTKFDLYRSIMEAMTLTDIVPLNAAVPSQKMFPEKEFSNILRKLVKDERINFMQYGQIRGLPSLKSQLSNILMESGVHMHPDELIITSSTTESINVALKTFTRPGDIIILESPTHFGYMPILESYGIYALEIPTDCSDGIDVSSLREALKKYKVSAALLQPNFANPTGGLYPEDKKKEIVKLMSEYNIPIIEDDIFGFLSYDKSRPTSMMSYDKKGMVIQVSSFSKTIAPIGVGWIRGGSFYNEILKNKLASSISVSRLLQYAFNEYLSTGKLNRHLNKIRGLYRQQTAVFRNQILESFPQGTTVSNPSGGFLLWVEMPEHIDTQKLYLKALDEKIAFAPGTLFTSQNKYDNCIRINCGHEWNPKIAKAIKRIGELSKEML